MADMIVKLYALEFDSGKKELLADGISIKRACIIDKHAILKFVEKNFKNESAWVNECEYALFNSPTSCHIAVKDKEIIGFSCYDATTKGFFGPMGVKKSYRKMGVGSELLMHSLYSMKERGYAYAIIGWVAPKAKLFYQKQVNAIEIEDSPPSKSIYKNLIEQE